MYYLVFNIANTFHFEGEQKKERTFSDKKLSVRTSPVRCSTVRLWQVGYRKLTPFIDHNIDKLQIHNVHTLNTN
mgnify:CR=1 FL=1